MALSRPDVTAVVGARPNFMKLAPIVESFRAAGITLRVVHTGQHFDESMSGAFFRELGMPAPDVNLDVGPGTHLAQMGEILRRIEPELTENRPCMLLVVGDVNSTAAGAIAAAKMGIPLAHVEAGLRSFDNTMPEEVNRRLTDCVAELLFTTEHAANENLLREGVSPDRIHFVGNVMIDTLLRFLPHAERMQQWSHFGLRRGQYAVLTLHRPSNVDDPDVLEGILNAVLEVAKRIPVVFPVHPRTRNRLETFNLWARLQVQRVFVTTPLPYLAMLSLLAGCRFVMTDSGGIQEESTVLRVPCLTLRHNTERPITVEVGTSRLVGNRPDAILSAVDQALAGRWPEGRIPEKWDGRAAERIAHVVSEWLNRVRPTNSRQEKTAGTW